MGISVEFLERRRAQREEARLRDFALYKKRIVKALRSFAPSKIYLFGSLTKRTWGECSDIDIAIEGIPIDKVAQVDRALKEAFGHTDFDIVLMEYAERSLLGSILHEGKLIYEK